jgi:hypothetical protein
VDAICIRQADIPERNNQVAKMADIFSASLKVLVWLGAGVSTDSLAFATIDVYTGLINASGSEGTVDTSSSEFNDSIDLETLRTALYEYTGPHVSFRRNLSVKEDVAIAKLISIFTIFEAKWFQRLWVVQETDAGHNVAYFRGYHEMKPNDLYEVLGFLQDNATLIRSRGIRIDCAALWHVLEHVTAYYSPVVHGGEIMFQFLRYSDRQCDDPRDRIFALQRTLGLENFGELRPDYKLDCVEVFRRLVCVCLNARHRPCNATNVEVERAKIGVEGRFLTNSALTLALAGTELKPRRESG